MAGCRHVVAVQGTETWWLAWLRFAEKGGEHGLVVAGSEWVVLRGPPWSSPCRRRTAEVKKTGGGLWFAWGRRRRGEAEEREGWPRMLRKHREEKGGSRDLTKLPLHFSFPFLIQACPILNTASLIHLPNSKSKIDNTTFYRLFVSKYIKVRFIKHRS